MGIFVPSKTKKAVPVAVKTDVDDAIRKKTESNTRTIRLLLLIITATLVVLGTMMMLLGISVYSHYKSFFLFLGSSRMTMTPSILTAFIGSVLIIVSIFGFVGSWKLSTFMVNLCAFTLMLLFFLQIVVVILAFTTVGDQIWSHIDVPVQIYRDPQIQRKIDMLQNNLACCGDSSFADYYDVKFGSNQPVVETTFLFNGDYLTMTLPKSCCSSVENGHCDRVRGTGCKFALYNSLLQDSTIIGIFGICVIVVNVMNIIFALLLARNIRKLKSTKTLLAWKLRESAIVMRQAKEKQQTQENQVHIEPQLSSVAEIEKK
ncbi:unnamed protein product [Spodoptera exigua]|nr:unnamed protein product [Spodoptera exigua]